MFLTRTLAINKRYIDHCSLTKTIVNKLIFVIIKKFIFAKALGAGWNWETHRTQNAAPSGMSVQVRPLPL